MCADDARFSNHSDDPTCLDFGPHTTARHDLARGTELTSDYRSFCRDPPTTTPLGNWSQPELSILPRDTQDTETLMSTTGQNARAGRFTAQKR